MKPAVKVLFASGQADLVPPAIERLKQIFPELPLEVVSEFPPPEGRWTPYYVNRSFRANLSLCRERFRGKTIRLAAILLDPRMPYWRLRLLAFTLAPLHYLAFNENLGHFMLRPRSTPVIARHLAWRARSYLKWEISPGGDIYTLLWRLRHPSAFRRPLLVLAARLGGAITAALKARPSPAIRDSNVPPLQPGISVIIPSRNGKDLLARALPEIVRESPSEIVVVDNGSEDGTAQFLRGAFPAIVVEAYPAPMSFARAVNAGIRAARFSHVCLLNNDMVVEPGFFTALRAAFDHVPDLFCATAQIFFPAGQRRQETGKAMMPAKRSLADFPVRCEPPIEGENLSYVLYGSGGCSLFDARKLRDLGGLDEIYEPAYVEDLDLGVRGWERGWPSVFVSQARVLHYHRATTSRYYSPAELDRVLQLNYLRFVARAVSGPANFRQLWSEAIRRLNSLAARQEPDPAALAALAQAWKAPLWTARRYANPAAIAHALALGNGEVSVTPGVAASSRPAVMIVTPYLPFPLAHGGAVRMFNLMRRAARDFDQILVSFIEEREIVAPELLDICVEVVTVKRLGSHAHRDTGRPEVVEDFDRPSFHAAVRQTVRKWKPAIAQLEFTQMAQYAPACAPAKTVLVEHDITFDLYRQMLAQGDDWELRRQLPRWIAFETEAWRRVDRVVTMSSKDQAMVPAAVCLPNGVDLKRFRASSSQPDPRRLLFIGSFAHLPNVLAIDFFLRECWPRLASLAPTLHVVAGARHEYFLGRYRDRVQPDFKQPGIQLDGFVADVRPAYEKAAVVIAPLLASAGTNIKIMEAMAMSKAVVSTPAGVNGLDLTRASGVLVVNGGAEMADVIRDLFTDPERRRTLERQARQTVERRFDWDAIALQQKQMYEELRLSYDNENGAQPKQTRK